MERTEKTKRPNTEKTMKATFGEKEWSGDVVFQMKNVEKTFGERTLFSGVDLKVEGGERIALLGDNGTGKSTVIRCLLGEETCGGTLQFGPTVKVGFLPPILPLHHPPRTRHYPLPQDHNCPTPTPNHRLDSIPLPPQA